MVFVVAALGVQSKKISKNHSERMFYVRNVMLCFCLIQKNFLQDLFKDSIGNVYKIWNF